jgi:hypothetical protein
VTALQALIELVLVACFLTHGFLPVGPFLMDMVLAAEDLRQDQDLRQEEDRDQDQDQDQGLHQTGRLMVGTTIVSHHGVSTPSCLV